MENGEMAMWNVMEDNGTPPKNPYIPLDVFQTTPIYPVIAANSDNVHRGACFLREKKKHSPRV